MKSIGIIAEYNPFHNGHLYQIEKIKEKYPDYAIVVVMSGHFTQRGEVTIIDKWKRTKNQRSSALPMKKAVWRKQPRLSTSRQDYLSKGKTCCLWTLTAKLI